MTDSLTVAEVLAMHTDQIERYGGSLGSRGQRAPGSRPLPTADWLLRRPLRSQPVQLSTNLSHGGAVTWHTRLPHGRQNECSPMMTSARRAESQMMTLGLGSADVVGGNSRA